MATCRDSFNKILLFARTCARIVGADVFDPNYRYTWLTKFVLFCIFTFYILSLYTIYVGVYIENNWTKMLQALCMVGSALQGLSKLISATEQQQRNRQLYKEVDEVYVVYEKKHIDYQEALNDTTTLISRCLKFSAFVYFAGVFVIMSVPAYHFLYLGEKMLIVQFIIPGIDPTTYYGYLLTISAHTLVLFMGAFGNFAGDMFFFIFLLHVSLFKNILRIKFEDMNKILLESDDSSETTLPLLVDVLRWHQQYSNFTGELSDIYFGVTFVQIFTTTASIAMTIFIIYVGAWPAGYGYLIYCFVVLYAYCGMGTFTEIANDDVCDYIYNTCLWYKLSVKERKMLIMMFRKSQNPTTLTVGGIMPLAVTTGLAMTKTIYSFLMMLLNFTEEE